MRTWIPTRFGRISAELTGNGPTLFLLHANPGDSLDYEAVVPALANHFLVVAVDWPGYGQSVAECPEKMSAMAFADALEDITGEFGTQPAWIIGNSVGGYAACRLAIRRPERVGGLVLVNTGIFLVQPNHRPPVGGTLPSGTKSCCGEVIDPGKGPPR